MNVQKRHVRFDDFFFLLAKPHRFFFFLQRPRYSREEVPSDRMRQDSTREETPEEGEI